MKRIPYAAILTIVYLGFTTPATHAQPHQPGSTEKRVTRAVRTDLYGDPLPDEALTRLGTIRLRQGNFICSLMFTPDGKALFAHDSNGVRLWDCGTGKLLRAFAEKPPGKLLGGACFAPDGKSLVTQDDGGVHLWDAASGKKVRTFGSAAVLCRCYSPDGKILAARVGYDPSRVELWDPATGRKVRCWVADKKLFGDLAFLPEGKTIVTFGSAFRQIPPEPDYSIRFWDVDTGKERQHIHLGPRNAINVAISADGKILATLCDSARVFGIYLWDVGSGKELGKLGTDKRSNWRPSAFTAAVFAPDGKTLYTGGYDDGVIAWDPTTGAERYRVCKGRYHTSPLAVSLNGRLMAAADGAMIRLIDLKSGQDLFPDVGHQMGVNEVAFTPDGRTVLTSEAKRIILWDRATGRELHKLTTEQRWFSAVHLLDAGKTLLSSESSSDKGPAILRLGNLETRKETARFDLPGKPGPIASLLAVTRDSKKAAVRDQESTVFVMNLDTGKTEKRLNIESGPNSFWTYGAAFIPDGRSVVTWANDNVVRCWDVATGRVLRRIPFINEWGSMPRPIGGGAGPLYTAAVSPDGRHVALGTQNRSIALHDLETGRLVRKLDKLGDSVGHIVFSDDSRTLAWGGYSDPAVRLIEVASGKERECLRGHRGGVRALAFAADNKMLISGGWDTTALIWDLTGRLSGGADWGKPLDSRAFEVCWAALANDDAAVGYRALRKLAAAPSAAVAYLEGRLTPVPAGDEKRLARLIADLDSPNFATRQKATKELSDSGEATAGYCRRALRGNLSLEARRRLEGILDKHDQVWRDPSPERLRLLRTVEALELAATPGARAVLNTLARGAPGARLTDEARAALDRLNRRPATTPDP
jgi:WD40 repeat protein